MLIDIATAGRALLVTMRRRRYVKRVKQVPVSMLGVRLDDDLERRLTAVARTQGRSKSDIAREAVRRYVDQHDSALWAEAKRQSLAAAARGWSKEDEAWEALAAADDDLSDLPRPDAAE